MQLEIRHLTMAAGLLWVAGFAAYLWRNAPLLAAPRGDGQSGCAEPLEQVQALAQPSASGHHH